jgi:hypothetical protein
MGIIAKSELIKRLRKEFGSDPKFERIIDNEWNLLSSIAAEIIPQIPKITLLMSSKEKLKIHSDINYFIKNEEHRYKLDDAKSEALQFILEYSSTNFRKLSMHALDTEIDEELYPKGKWRSQLGYLFAIAVLGVLVYFKYGDISIIQIIALVVMAIVVITTI